MAAHQPPLPHVLVHTGQHYDSDMSERLFTALALPTPDVNLHVQSGNHATLTADVMRRFDPLLDTFQPSCVVVVGDVNSTLACSLVACKRGIPVAHVESGLRSFDRSMPEEINRVLTDQIADRLYTTERSAGENLGREGVSKDRVVFAGNVMIDSVVFSQSVARQACNTLEQFGADPSLLRAPQGFGVVTLHRPSNVDDPLVLRSLLDTLQEVAQRIPLVFSIHPRTRANILRFEFSDILDSRHIAVLPPVDYLQMLGLMAQARMVLTDSGGLQEETTALGVPCLTLRENTERHITVEQGTNTLVGRDRQVIIAAVEDILQGIGKQGCVPECWDGRAAERIVADLYLWLQTQ
jgi:UDP-N-acetylglucosamine 2-epimerase (non-hydrolysing)